MHHDVPLHETAEKLARMGLAAAGCVGEATVARAPRADACTVPALAGPMAPSAGPVALRPTVSSTDTMRPALVAERRIITARTERMLITGSVLRRSGKSGDTGRGVVLTS